jgi:hypothetical protein
VATAIKNQDLTSLLSSDKAKHDQPKDLADQQHEVPQTLASPDTKMAKMD